MSEPEFLDDDKAVPGDPLYDEISRINNELINIRRQLAKQNIDLERLNAEKNRFLGMAAHDLRSPLTIIDSYSEFLLDEIGDQISEEHEGFLKIINKTSRFMAGLVNDLLDISAIESEGSS